MEKKKIILVDDHILFRTALVELIEKIGDYAVVKQFDNGRTFLDALPLMSDIDLIMLDIIMPVMDGMETLLKLKEIKNSIPVLIITDNDDDLQAIRVFRIGARGYLRKNCTGVDFKEAITAILTTGYFHNKYFAYSVEEQITPGPVKKPKRETILEKLDTKEKLFLRLVCHEDEYQYKEIADQMDISLRSAEKIREELFERFAVKSKAGLILYIFRYDLFDSL